MKNNSSSLTITVAKAGSCNGEDGECHQGHGAWSTLVGSLLGGLRRL
jgi:hypothetical protein